MCNGLFWQPLYAFNTLLFEESAAKVQIVSLFSVPPVTRFDTPHSTMAALRILLLNPGDPIRGEAGAVGVKRPIL